jgi:type IV pilus assembly protein PilM
MNTAKIDKFFTFLDLPPKPLIGVDISHSSIKCVELSLGRNGALSLDNYSIEPTPKGAFHDQGIVDADELGAALRRAFKKLGTSVKRIAIAIPGNIAITKKVKFSNNLDEIAISEEVKIEAAQFIPFPIDEVFIDWMVLGPHPNSPETDNEVLICATRHDRIQEYMAMAEAAGLEVGVVDIDTFSQQRAFEGVYTSSPEYQDEVIAVAEAGDSMLTIAVYNRGAELVFSKEIAFGTNQLNESISQAYGVTRDQAEEFKRLNGEGLTDYQSQVMTPFLDNLGMEINRALQFFLTQATVGKIDRILLAGACCGFDSAAVAIARSAQIPTSVCNPFAHMNPSGRLKNKNMAKDAPMMMTACGLALRRFDK